MLEEVRPSATRLLSNIERSLASKSPSQHGPTPVQQLDFRGLLKRRQEVCM